MIGRDPKLVITPEDDQFHLPTSEAENWLETMWFPVYVAEAGLSVSLRLWFSANQGLCGGACVIWTGENHILHGDRWHGALKGTPDLTDFAIDERGTLKRLQTLQTFQLDYTRGAVKLSVCFDGTMAPNPVDPAESPGMFEGHFEQPGRVTGTLEIDGQHHVIDCHSLRDRSWGPREMIDGMRLGNAYGGCDGMAFFTYIKPDEDGNELITGGFISAPDGDAAIVGGQRTTRWDNGWPSAVALTAEDAMGRTLELKGIPSNRFASNAGHGVYAIMNLMQWRGEGKTLWGENHDIWSEPEWLAAGREAL